MNFFKKIFLFVLIILAVEQLPAQKTDTLPGFTIRSRNGKVFLRWINKYPVVKQITIQRSKDANKANFRSIISLSDPEARENGYYDKTAANDSSYYRIYIQLAAGNFFYTTIKQPKNDSVQTEIIEEGNLVFRDSIAMLQARNDSIRLGLIKINFIRPVKPRSEEPVYPSKLIYTLKDGNVLMDLPLAEKQKYNVVFQDESGNEIFQVPEISQLKLTIDKVNFLRAGWFIFKLYEDGKLKEINRVFIPKE
jgi:hypothetical protein